MELPDDYETRYREEQVEREREAIRAAQNTVIANETKKADGGRWSAACHPLVIEATEGIEQAMNEALGATEATGGSKIERLLRGTDTSGMALCVAKHMLGAFLRYRSYNTSASDLAETGIGYLLSELSGRPKGEKVKARKARQEKLALLADEVIKERLGLWLLKVAEVAGVANVMFFPSGKRSGGYRTSVKRVSLADHYLARWRENLSDMRLVGQVVRLRPMVCKPDQFQRGNYTGFITDEMKSLKRFRAKFGPVRRMKTPSRMMNILNTIQNVPLAINGGVLEVEQALMRNPETRIHVVGFEAGRILCPERDAERYSKRHIRAHNHNAAMVDVRASMVLKEASELCGRPFWLTCFPDWRGRIYSASYFSHQGADYMKALIRFQHKVPLGVKGYDWLLIHTANVWDKNKISKEGFPQRINFVLNNRQVIEQIADDPLGNLSLWLTGEDAADKPFQFLAACLELTAAWRYPEGVTAFPSGLSVAVDGANSGLQHYAAAAHSREGEHVCLTPMDKPADFYSAVAALVAERAKEEGEGIPDDQCDRDTLTGYAEQMKALKESGMDDKDALKASRMVMDAACAAAWDRVGVARKTVKRSVMTYTYSAGQYGFTEQVMEDTIAPMWARGTDQFPFDTATQGFWAAAWMGQSIYEAVKTVLPVVHSNMVWMQNAAAFMAKRNLPLEFETFMGWPVRIDAPSVVVKTIRMSVGGVEYQVQTYREGDTKNARKARSTTPPNAIHACDGCHLQLVTEAMQEAGMTDLLFVHDEFACPAGNMDTLHSIARNKMADMYDHWSPMWAIYSSAAGFLDVDEWDEFQETVGVPPDRGTLTTEEIRNATYMFG